LVRADGMRRALAPRVLLDAEEEVGRDEDGLDGQADRVFEGIALLAGAGGQADERSDLAGRHGPPIGPAREAGHDPAHASRPVPAVEMPADVDPLQARS